MNTTKPDKFDVVIAGAGFAGLSTAKALADGLCKSTRIAVVMRERWGAWRARKR